MSQFAITKDKARDRVINKFVDDIYLQIHKACDNLECSVLIVTPPELTHDELNEHVFKPFAAAGYILEWHPGKPTSVRIRW